MDAVYIVLLSAGAAALAAVLVVTLSRRRPMGEPGDMTARLAALETELGDLREAKAIVERKLAVEEERGSRILGLERSVAEKTEQADALTLAKGLVESQLATSTEGLARVETALEETKARLLSTEQGREEIRAQLDSAREEKSELEETLAAKTEALTRVEAGSEELRQRLETADVANQDLMTRIETAAREKAELEAAVAEKSALLDERGQTLADVNGRLKQASIDIEAAQTEGTALRERLATLQETLDQERKQAVDKLALLTDAKDQMTQEFKLLANEVMKGHAETFTKQNKEQIDTILLPLREKLGEFQQGLQTAHTESAKERATLGEQIRQLTESSAKMTTETSNLTRALKGETRTRGAWGEMILESILERSGLREGEEYILQENLATDDGRRRRPDVTINLPGGQRIIVDSKLSLIAFEEFVNAEDEVARAGALARHLDSMRAHIKGLANKEYHVVAGSHVDYVIMFVPIEGALAAALQGDPGLTNFAVDNGVAIATPTTLMIALRTVANVWQVERRNRNAEAIAERAGRLYDKMVGFVQDMLDLGNRLSQARTEYDKAMGKLSTGSGNLIRQVEQLKDLGAKTAKSLPAQLIDGDALEALSALSDAPVEA